MINKFKIIRVSRGIANRFPDYLIEVNNKLYLEQYKPLLFEIIEHEKAHTDKGWNISDFVLDCVGVKNKWLYWKFVLTTPNSWWQFSPVYKNQEGKFYFDLTLIITYGILLIFIGLISMEIIKWI